MIIDIDDVESNKESILSVVSRYVDAKGYIPTQRKSCRKKLRNGLFNRRYRKFRKIFLADEDKTADHHVRMI